MKEPPAIVHISQEKLLNGKRRWGKLNSFVDHQASKISDAAVAVWLIMFRHAKPNGMVSIPQTQIARLAGKERKSVAASQKELVSHGLLKEIASYSPEHHAYIFIITGVPCALEPAPNLPPVHVPNLPPEQGV